MILLFREISPAQIQRFLGSASLAPTYGLLCINSDLSEGSHQASGHLNSQTMMGSPSNAKNRLRQH